MEQEQIKSLLTSESLDDRLQLLDYIRELQVNITDRDSTIADLTDKNTNLINDNNKLYMRVSKSDKTETVVEDDPFSNMVSSEQLMNDLIKQFGGEL